MSGILYRLVVILTSQGATFGYLIIVPVCVLNILPFLTLLFALSKTQQRALLTTVIACDTALVMVAACVTHEVIYSVKYDTWMHLAIIQRGITHGLFAGDPYYPHHPTPPHYSLVDVFYIYASKSTGLAPHVLWGHLSFLFAGLMFLASVCWYRELFQGARLGWLTGLWFIVSLSGIWHYATYPRHVALIFFFLTLFFYFRSANRIRDVVYCGVSLGLCIMTHLFTGVMCVTLLIGYVLLGWGVDAIHRKQWLWKHELRRLASIPIGCIVGSPWLYVFGKEALTHTETSASQYSIPGWHVDTTILGWTFTIYKPSRFVEAFSNDLWILAGIGFLICVVYIVRGDYEPRHVFLVSSAIIPVLVLLTPLYLPVVRAFGEWMPSRFLAVMPVPPLAVVTCAMLGRCLLAIKARYKPLGAGIAGAGLILAFTLMVLVVGPCAVEQKLIYEGRDKILTPLLTWDKDFLALNGMLDEKVVLTDPTTAYFLPYYTGAYVVATRLGHGSPYINDEARHADVSAMFDPNTSVARRYELLNRYQVGYIMLNFRRPRADKTASRAEWIPRAYLGARKATFDQKTGFRLVYDVNDLVVYEYQRVDQGGR